MVDDVVLVGDHVPGADDRPRVGDAAKRCWIVAPNPDEGLPDDLQLPFGRRLLDPVVEVVLVGAVAERLCLPGGLACVPE